MTISGSDKRNQKAEQGSEIVGTRQQSVGTSMETGLKGKVALVCAASRGLGRAAAMALAAEGARISICARHMPTLETTAADIQAATGAEVLAVAADLTRRSDVVRLVDQTARHFGGLDILVTNAGGPKAGSSARSRNRIGEAIDLLLMSTILLCQEAVRTCDAGVVGGSSTSLPFRRSNRSPV